jgi:EAL domain-containing protein (putative c-di-GMP-specific phosphodiesterase class I)
MPPTHASPAAEGPLGPLAHEPATRTWDEMLARAVEGEGVTTVFQPVVDLARGAVAGYEALTRFTAAPALTPDRWFAEADLRGLGAALDAATLRAALRHRAGLPAGCFLTLNVEPDSLASAAVRAVLAGAGSLAGVVLELTEHRPVRSNDVATDLLRPHRRAGALVAVDDAGAGYAGLQQILQLRPEIVKIDRALVGDVDRDEAKASLIEMLAHFASRIDAWVLAEGVERAEEARRLRRLRVPLAQGYFFGRPAPPWAGIEPDAAVLAVDDAPTEVRPTTLRPLLEVVPWVRADLGRPVQDAPEAPHVVAIDRTGRPVAVISRLDGKRVSRVISGPSPSVETRPVDLAHRLATARSAAVPDPIPVVDREGAYVGVVRLQALLAELARSSEGPTEPW